MEIASKSWHCIYAPITRFSIEKNSFDYSTCSGVSKARDSFTSGSGGVFPARPKTNPRKSQTNRCISSASVECTKRYENEHKLGAPRSNASVRGAHDGDDVRAHHLFVFATRRVAFRKFARRPKLTRPFRRVRRLPLRDGLRAGLVRRLSRVRRRSGSRRQAEGGRVRLCGDRCRKCRMCGRQSAVRN